jgi:hypothetical protein
VTHSQVQYARAVIGAKGAAGTVSKEKMGHVGVIVGHRDVKSGESVTVAGVYVDGANAEKE